MYYTTAHNVVGYCSMTQLTIIYPGVPVLWDVYYYNHNGTTVLCCTVHANKLSIAVVIGQFSSIIMSTSITYRFPSSTPILPRRNVTKSVLFGVSAW